MQNAKKSSKHLQNKSINRFSFCLLCLCVNREENMKNRIIKAISISLLCITLISCKSNSTEDQREGGVDGSGGLLPAWSKSGLQNWLKDDFPFELRDVVYRLELIKSRSPDALPFDQAMTDSLFGSTPGSLMNLVNSINIEVVDGYCQSVDHGGASDASVDQSGRVCISYIAFKNIPFETLYKKMISMIFHEVGHLRGFTEQEAVALQMKFDRGSLGEQTILTLNKDYRELREVFRRINSKLSLALVTLLKKSVINDRQESCDLINLAQDRYVEFYKYSRTLPKYLINQIDEPYLKSLMSLGGYCDSTSISDNELGEKLVDILSQSIRIEHELIEFESPMCDKKICANRINYYSQMAIQEWNLFKNLNTQNLKDKEIDHSEVKCDVTDLKNGKTFDFVFPDSDLTKDNQYLAIKGEVPGYTFGILLTKNSPMHKFYLFEIVLFSQREISIVQDGAPVFQVDSSLIGGKLVPNLQEKVSTRIGIMEIEGNIGFDPFFSPIRKKPTLSGEFEFKCEYSPR